MSSTRTSSVRRGGDHFEPDASMDPQAQRRLRGYLEKIDYTAYACNREVMAHVLGSTDPGVFQHLALAAAHARANWVKSAIEASVEGHSPNLQQIEKIARLRVTYEELAEAYEGLRRLVERGYL